MMSRTTEMIICLSLILLIVVVHVFASLEFFNLPVMDLPAEFDSPPGSVYSGFPESSTWTADYGMPFGDACLGADPKSGRCTKNQKFSCTLNPHNKYTCSWT